MTETIAVKLLTSSGMVVDRAMNIATGEQCKLSLTESETRVHSAEGPDLFEALRALRRTLEGEDVRILCAGARIDVYPSGMSRSMSGGRKAYVLRLGASAQGRDIVDIFDYAPPAKIGTIEQQDQYYKDWVASLRAASGEAVPYAGEIEEAKRHPGGWVYRIAPAFQGNVAVPPDAIVGAWKVGADGRIAGKFVKNEKYDAAKWRSSKR